MIVIIIVKFNTVYVHFSIPSCCIQDITKEPPVTKEASETNRQRNRYINIYPCEYINSYSGTEHILKENGSAWLNYSKLATIVKLLQ